MSLLQTLLTDARAQFPSQVDRDEWRETEYGLLVAAQEMSASPNTILDVDLVQKAKDSEGRVLKIPVMKIGDDITISAVRTCSVQKMENESELVEVTWVTLVADIHMVKNGLKNNTIKYQQDLMRKFNKVDRGFCQAIEGLIFTLLDNEASDVFNSPSAYPVVGGEMQVPLADQEMFFNRIKTIMKGDDFYSNPYKVLANTTLETQINHYVNQGGGNDENLNYSFAGLDFRLSNHVTQTAGANSTGFIMPDGSFGMITRNAVDSVNGETTTDGTEWGTIAMPKLGFEVGQKYHSTCEDMSAVTGMEHLSATAVEYWQLSFDVAFVAQYNSDPLKAGGIKKFSFMA